jgi:spermidine/putrescine transport system permease protein
MKGRRFFENFGFFVLVFLYLPIVVLVINSFNESRFGGVWSGFSLKWYEKLLTERAVWQALYNSLTIAGITTVVTTILGTSAALALQRYQSFLQKTHYAIMYLPLVVPDVLMGVSLLLFFVSLGFGLGLTTVCIAHITFCVSYVTMLVRSRLQSFDYTLVEAAYDLGATTRDVFFRILIPHLWPAMFASLLLTFTLSLDDFVITFFVVGPGVTTLPIYVYSMIKFGSPQLINALSVILLSVTFCIIWLTHRLVEKK